MTRTVTPPPSTSVRRGPGFWAARLVDVLMVVTVVGLWADPRAYRDPRVLLWYGALWIVLGLVHVTIRLVRLRRSRRDDPGWEGRLLGRRTAYLVTVATSFQVISYGVAVPVFASGPDGALLALAVVVLIVAWAVLHLSYAERYARIWRREADRTGAEPIAFPGTPSPRLRDFAYFSVTVGLSFATSDAEIRSSKIRSVVVWHAVLSFAYNTAILGMIVGLIAG